MGEGEGERVQFWLIIYLSSPHVRQCHYNDRLWGYAIRTTETWRTSDRETWRDPILALLFRMGSFNWESEDKLMNQAKQAIRLGTATSI